MKYSTLLIASFICFLSCVKSTVSTSKLVHNFDELKAAISNAVPGDHIIMRNGNWEDIQIKITANGTENQPIKLSAETPGKVVIQGQSNLQLGGNYLIIDGLYFINGRSPSKTVIDFAVEDTVANHSIVTNCVIQDYNKLQRNFQDLWVLFRGRHNQLDHCYLAGKSNRGPTVRVDLAGNQNINNHHKIIYNHFGPRPPKGGPSAETIQIGNSHTSMCPSHTLVANNFFEACNGEVEIISSKTNNNEFRNNVFYKSEGSLVTRHGNYCTVDGNYFIGDESNNNIGGVRLIGTGHTVTNNYFYNLRGQEFRSPLAVMNGIPKSPLNRYIQVTDVVIAYNSWINCNSPLQFGVGSNVSQKDVLPASEIRSARPIRTVVANNLIYNSKGDQMPIVAHDKLDGVLFKNNIIHNKGIDFEKTEGVETVDIKLKEIADFVLVPTSDFSKMEVYDGFGFEQFDTDLFGTSRAENNSVGAISGQPNLAPPILDKSQYGADWFFTANKEVAPNKLLVSKHNSLADAIAKAADGDVIEVESGDYEIKASLKIDKHLTISSKTSDGRVKIIYSGSPDTPLFEMNPKGNLTLDNLHLSGTDEQYCFASLKENMSSLYNLRLNNCTVENFAFILKAYKYSFSEYIILENSTFKDCKNGIELSEEIDDRGEYNAENILIYACTFDGISANVMDYYRGGYDESTVGGNLSITKSTFMNCGAAEINGIMLNTYGIINVDISDNIFKNNKVEKIAKLWGAKNNTHSKNEIFNSGKIVVEENLQQKTFY